MLYTESMEMVSPLLVGAQPSQATDKQTVATTIKNRFAKPRLDVGLRLGSSSFSACTGTTSVITPGRAALRGPNAKLVALGARAAEIEGREPEGVTVFRPIRGGVVTHPKIAATLLARTIASAEHGLIGAPRIVLSVPAGLSAVDSQALLNTVHKAGAQEVYLVDQGMAAAIGAGRDLCKPEGHLVVHVGSTVSQVTVSALASPVLSQGKRLAGDDMTQALVEHLRRVHEISVDWNTAEMIKKELGTALPVIDEKTLTIVGSELSSGGPVEKNITASEVYKVLRPYLEAIIEEAKWVVSQMAPELLSDVHRNGVIISGGASKLHGFDKFLEDGLRLSVAKPEEPENLVNLGLQRLLREFTLRRAVFDKQSAVDFTPIEERRRGTGLMGLFLLTSALALTLSSGTQLQQSVSSGLEPYLNGLVIPSAPLSESWGWHAPHPEAALVGGPTDSKEKASSNQEISAQIVGRDPRGWLSTVSLNVGSDQGVEQGMTVSAEGNLVGQVTRVQKNSSQVRLSTDESAVVAARLQGKPASGVVVGSGERALSMRYLDPEAGVEVDDLVLTNGQDGIFPAGLVVGQVVGFRLADKKSDPLALIKPLIDIGSLEKVTVTKR